VYSRRHQVNIDFSRAAVLQTPGKIFLASLKNSNLL
jgi:hypothetical protein